ncbi:PKD domain-containing protein [Halorussus halophilus]|uniref:PKD domain-containing protein n=1 Tax=Halorussus halophilus TaxID=2650975 RepID=UPI001CE46123|nr:PKD domain-containing protein [Halorussus halophilus]
MWTRIPVAVLTLLVVTTAVSGLTAPTGERPLADAGLDQSVSKGATVLLDGTGSLDPDGAIEAYRWTIRTPNDVTISPDCADCARTSFEPSEVGTYRVTLTVTDDDGNRRSDHLFVEVSPGERPSIELSGPTQSTAGDTETYTVDLDAGSASLDYIVWTIGGVEVANHSLAATQPTDTVDKLFPTPGERTVTATVYDVDGQFKTDSVQVSVQSSQPVPSPDPTPSPSPRTIASRNSPTVSGERTITGSRPLRGTYSLDTDTGSGRIRTIDWRNAAGTVGGGTQLTRAWSPGDHELYAVVTYTDGSQNIATFPDGETSVVADPRPNVSFTSLDRYGAISGAVSALDEYENLREVRVLVDGRVVETSFGGLRGRHRLDMDRRQNVEFSMVDFLPGEEYRVTVVATDSRGQTTRTSRKIVPVKKPEIVKSEFVNGPMDSYHPRIDAERYAAHHVLKIELNGVDREKVVARVKSQHPDSKKINSAPHYSGKEYNKVSDTLTIDSYWAGKFPGEYDVESAISYEFENKRVSSSAWDILKVTPSKPEIRMEIVNDGTNNIITREHGMVVNVSDSFDPDGTDLKFIWTDEVTPLRSDNSTAKFSAYENASLVVEDGHNRSATDHLDFLAYLPPRIVSKSVISEGPHYPNETVKVRVRTIPFDFSKKTYEKDFKLGISVSNPQAEVVSWGKVDTTSRGHSGATESPRRYVGIIEIPASELSPGSKLPSITVTNKKNERKKTTIDFPEPDVLVEDGEYWTNVTVENLTYTIEEPQLDEVVAKSPQTRIQYLRQGYQVKEEREETEYVLEKRVKVSDAEYRPETKNFRNERMKNAFLESASDWYDKGTAQVQKTRTRTSSDWFGPEQQMKSAWRDGSVWNGEATGQTKRVVVDPAEYQTERKYEYDYRVEKTGTRTVTHTRSYRVKHTGTRTIEHCSLRFGCYTTTEEYTYYTVESYTYTTTESYTYYVTKTNTYWALSKFDSSHDYTGQSRRVKTENAEYESRYEVEWKTSYTETVTRHQVGRDVLVQPAQYEWQARQQAGRKMMARKQASLSDEWRMGETVTSTKWILVKSNGTRRYKASYYENASDVVETSATIRGDFVKRYYSAKQDTTVRRVESNTERYSSGDAVRRGEIRSKLTQEDEESQCPQNLRCRK